MDSTSYEISSYSFELDAFLTKSGKVKVPLIVNSFLTNGFKYLAITFNTFYIQVPVWSNIGRNLSWSTFISSSEFMRRIGNKELGWLFWNRAYFIVSEYPWNFMGNFFPNILGISHGNVLWIFQKHILARWDLNSHLEKKK